MPYNIQTKDGITVTDIPDDIPDGDSRLRELVARMRAAGQKSGSYPALTGTPAAGTGQAPGTLLQPQRDKASMEAMELSLHPPVETARQRENASMASLAEAQAAAAAPPPPPKTDIEGMMGAVVRGGGPIAAGALAGAAMGAPIGGVGAIPGAAAGAGAMALTQFVGDPLVGIINSMFGTNLTKPTDALNQLFTAMGVPEPDTAAERVIQAAAAGGGGALGTVALGQALAQGTKQLAPSAVKAIGDALASGAAAQVGGGIGSGVASQGAAELGAPPLAQMAAGIGGGVVGSMVGGMKPTALPTAPIKEAEAAGVRVLTSDVRPPQTAGGKWFQRRFEEMPLGTGPLRVAQATERVNAVRNVMRQFGADDLAAASNEVMDDLLRTRGAALDKWTSAKTEVIQRLAQEATTPVPMPATIAKIDESIAMLQKMNTKQVEPVIGVLNDWKTAIQNQDLATIELLRKQIGDVFTAPDMASVRSTGEKVLSGIYGSVNEDMGAFIKAAGKEADFTKWKVANTELSKMAKELERPALKAALERGAETPELVGNLLFSRKKSDVEALYKNLSPTGKAAARAAVLAKAAGSAGADVSPDKFAASVKKMGDQVGVFFTGDELKQVNGLMRVLDFTKRSTQATAQPLTGVQTALPVGAAALGAGLSQVFGSGPAGFGAAVAAGGSVGLSARLYESKIVRDILMQLPKMVPGSPEEFAAMKRLMEVVQVEQQKAGRPAPERK